MAVTRGRGDDPDDGDDGAELQRGLAAQERGEGRLTTRRPSYIYDPAIVEAAVAAARTCERRSQNSCLARHARRSRTLAPADGSSPAS